MRAFVALGSNLGDRERTLRDAVAALDAEPGIDVVAVSQLRETDPVGLLDQPRFLNGAAMLETAVGARQLLDTLLAIEQRFGRRRDDVPAHGPRTLDLDLLLYGGERLDEPGLHVPHPRLHERRFVLEPLADLDPDLDVPGRGRVAELLTRVH